jgi:hypothetical protein
MVADPSLRREKLSILPGDTSFAGMRDGRPGFAPVYQVQPEIQHLEAKQQQVRLRIQRAFYEDLFLMLAETDRRQITAREIEERHEEKLLALGPVLEQLNQDLLDPLIDNTYAIMERQGLIPEAPEELHGKPVMVLTSQSVQHAKLRVDSRKWLASKMFPKQYGDKQDINLSGTLDIAATILEARKRAGVK